jgi:hypothetical protein
VDLRGCEDVNWVHLALGKFQLQFFCEHGYEHLGFTKCEEFLEWLSNY